jgi:hypothetical protein
MMMSCVKHEAKTRSMHIAHTARYTPWPHIPLLCVAEVKFDVALGSSCTSSLIRPAVWCYVVETPP